MTNILIIIFIFEGHIEKHGSVGVFLQINLGNANTQKIYTQLIFSNVQ